MKIKIKADGIELNALLNESLTAKKVFDALPLRGTINKWGDEVYFEIPIHIDIEQSYARETVSVGNLGFWPSGDCFCIFFGRTPASTGGEPRAASPVNVFGKVIGDSTLLRQTKDGDHIAIEKA
jgi:hypothetical protein